MRTAESERAPGRALASPNEINKVRGPERSGPREVRDNRYTHSVRNIYIYTYVYTCIVSTDKSPPGRPLGPPSGLLRPTPALAHRSIPLRIALSARRPPVLSVSLVSERSRLSSFVLHLSESHFRRGILRFSPFRSFPSAHRYPRPRPFSTATRLARSELAAFYLCLAFRPRCVIFFNSFFTFFFFF